MIEVPIIKTKFMECSRCKRDIEQSESHHTWCKFMDNPHGYTWKNYQNRFWLCISCHKALHQKIIIPLLNEKARTLKLNGSENCLWKKIAPIDKDEVKDMICEATIKFILNYNG